MRVERARQIVSFSASAQHLTVCGHGVVHGLANAQQNCWHLRAALAMDFGGPALVNVKLHHAAGRKPQEFGCLTT